MIGTGEPSSLSTRELCARSANGTTVLASDRGERGDHRNHHRNQFSYLEADHGGRSIRLRLGRSVWNAARVDYSDETENRFAIAVQGWGHHEINRRNSVGSVCNNRSAVRHHVYANRERARTLPRSLPTAFRKPLHRRDGVALQRRHHIFQRSERANHQSGRPSEQPAEVLDAVMGPAPEQGS